MESAVPAEVTAALEASAELGLFFGLRSPQAERTNLAPGQLALSADEPARLMT